MVYADEKKDVKVKSKQKEEATTTHHTYHPRPHTGNRWGYPLHQWSWGFPSYQYPVEQQFPTFPPGPQLPKGYSIWYPNPWNMPILVPTDLLSTLPTIFADSEAESVTEASAESTTEMTPDSRKAPGTKNKKLLRDRNGFYGLE